MFDMVSISDTNAASDAVSGQDAARETAVGITAHATDADGSNNTITYSLDESAVGVRHPRHDGRGDRQRWARSRGGRHL